MEVKTPPRENKHRGISTPLEETILWVFILHCFRDLIKSINYGYQAFVLQLQSSAFAFFCFLLQTTLTEAFAVKIANTHKNAPDEDRQKCCKMT